MHRSMATRLFALLFCFLTTAAFAAGAKAPRYIAHANAVPSEYIVGLAEGVAIADAQRLATALARDYGLTVVHVYKHAFAGFECRGNKAAAQKMAADGRVAWVEENAVGSPSAVGVKETAPYNNTTDVKGGWNLRRIGQRKKLTPAELSSAGEYGYGSGGEGVRAYIVDSAVQPDHEDFEGRVEPGYDAIRRVVNSQAIYPCAPTIDLGESCDQTQNPVCRCGAFQGLQCVNGGHGTAVASLLGGKAYGVAPKVTIVPVRILDCNSPRGMNLADTINGLDWIAGDIRANAGSIRGAVVNISSEMPITAALPAEQTSLGAAIRAVVHAGGVVFVAAGNHPQAQGTAGDSCRLYPAAFAYNNGGPAPHVITVSGTDHEDKRYVCTPAGSAACANITEFGYGQCVDFFVPATAVKSAAIRATDGRNSTSGERTESRDGTSWAAPQLAGIAARLLSERSLYNRFNAGITSDLVRNALREAATANAVDLNGKPAATRLMGYIGGVPLLSEPYVMFNVAQSGSTPAQARLRVEVPNLGSGHQLSYEWFKGDYTSAVSVQNGSNDYYLAPRNEAASYWVKVTDTFTQAGATKTTRTDSAILPLTRCDSADGVVPRIDIYPTGTGRWRLIASKTGTSYTWFSGPYNDPIELATTTTGEYEVANDTITEYWVRINTGGNCTLDSARVSAAPLCPLGSDIHIAAPVLNVLGTEIVRLAELVQPTPGAPFQPVGQVPELVVPAGGRVAMTMRISATGRVEDARWSGQPAGLTVFRQVNTTGDADAEVTVAGCVTRRRVHLVALGGSRLLTGDPAATRSTYRSADYQPTASPLPPDIKISVAIGVRVQVVEWRRGPHDDRQPRICDDREAGTCPAGSLRARIETTFATAFSPGVTTITIVNANGSVPTVGPGEYWVRLLGVGASGERGPIEDSNKTMIRCDDCRPIPRIRGLVKVNNKPTTQHTKANASTSVTLAVPSIAGGNSYEWRKGEYDENAAVVSTEASWTTSDLGTFWVRTASAADVTASHLVRIDVAEFFLVEVEPESAAIALDRTAKLTAQPTAACAAPLTFRWFNTDPRPLTPAQRTIHQIDEGPEYFVIAPTDDVTVWVEASCGNGTGVKPVTITVLCEPVASVNIISNPLDPHLAKNDLIGLSALGLGKALLYNWYEGAEGNQGASTLVAHGPGLLRQPMVDTALWVRAEDGCGNVATDAVTLYLCKPTLSPLPETLVVTTGSSKILTINSTPAQPGQESSYTYQWYSGDSSVGFTAISGAQSQSLTVTQAGNYYVAVTGTCGDGYRPIVNSTVTHVTLCNPPQISAISNTTVASGQPGAISVTATGSNLTFQWYRGEELLTGETVATLVVSPAATTTYWCRVTSDNNCSTDSAVTTVTVCAAPSITTQPQPVKIRGGQTAPLSVAGSGATAYQWYFTNDANPITGATAASYTTTALTQDTSYKVRLLNGPCTTDSQPVTVTVCHLNVVLAADRTQVEPSQAVTLTTTVTNQRSQELFYQWYLGASGNTSQLVTEGPALPARLVNPTATTSYWVRVSDGTCTIDSPSVLITVCSPPQVTAHPQSQLLDKTQNPSASKMLTVGATGDGRTNQWYIGEKGVTTSPIAGATTDTITVSPNATTKYWARVTGQCGTPADSNAAEITLCVAPSIGTQPVSKTTGTNVPAQIEVAASGTNLTYAWYAGAAGNTSTPVGTNSLALTVTISQTTQYWVRVTGACGTVNSNTATISVAPAINTPPVDRKITKNTSATFTVAASGTFLSYQWYQGATAIGGATATSYTTPALAVDTPYRVRVYSGSAYIESAVVQALVYQPKSIAVSQPSSNAGSSVTLSVVSPDGNETYTWYRGATGDTSVSLGTGTAKIVTPDTNTSYWLRNAGYGCTADSAAVTVVTCAPRVTQQPAAVSINEGSATTLQVAAAGNAPLVYKWYEGQPGTYTTPVASGDAASVSVAPTTTRTYFAKVTSGSCVTNSNAVTVTVCNIPRITGQPSQVTTTLNATANLTVAATGTALQYQWYRGASGDTANPVGTNAATLTVSPVVATHDYWVRVSGQCGTAVNSNAAKVSIPPALSAPTIVYVASGQPAAFTVSASGHQLSYQWYQGSTPQSGGTGATFTTPALSADTTYWVRVWSGNAYADSGLFQAVVCTPRDFSVWQPSNVAGSAVTLTVTPQAGDSYAWYQGAGGALLLGQNSQVTVSPEATTTYTLRTWRGSCYADRSVTITVCIPRITLQPAGTMINPGGTHRLSVNANGTSPVTFQWYSTAAGAISGATNYYYDVSPTVDTTYFARVTSGAGASCYLDTNAVVVQVCNAPVITSQPPSTIIYSSDTVTLTAGATGTELTYQWYESTTGTNVVLSGATSNTLVIQPGTTRSFWVRVTGRCGYVDSQVATQSVRPTITAQPANTSVCAGANATFTIGVTGSGLSFRWYEGGSGAFGALLGTSPTLTIAVSAPKTVWCEISSGAAVVNSQAATASVTAGPLVGVYKGWMGWGDNFYLTASVTNEDLGYVTYAWYQGPLGNTSQPISTSATVMVYAPSTTWYWVRVVQSQTGCWTDKVISAPY
jgi:hypothetical protein